MEAIDLSWHSLFNMNLSGEIERKDDGDLFFYFRGVVWWALVPTNRNNSQGLQLQVPKSLRSSKHCCQYLSVLNQNTEMTEYFDPSVSFLNLTSMQFLLFSQVPMEHQKHLMKLSLKYALQVCCCYWRILRGILKFVIKEIIQVGSIK